MNTSEWILTKKTCFYIKIGIPKAFHPGKLTSRRATILKQEYQETVITDISIVKKISNWSLLHSHFIYNVLGSL